MIDQINEAIENFIKYYARDYFGGLTVAALSDPIVTSLVLGSSIRNKQARQFFMAYAASRTVNTVANAIGVSGQALARAVVHGSNA